MAIKVPNAGELRLLDFLSGAGGDGLDECKIHLYTNDLTPTDTTVLGDLTEAAFAGYAAQTVSTWPPATTVSGKASSTVTVIFSNTSGSSQNVYGYHCTNNGSTQLLFLERFSGAPISIPTGQGIVVVITFTGQSES